MEQSIYLYPFNLQINNAKTNTVINGTQNNVAFVLISHGENGICAYDNQNNSTPKNLIFDTNSFEKYNCYNYWITDGKNPLNQLKQPYNSSTYYNYAKSTTEYTTSNPNKPITLYTDTYNKNFDDYIIWSTMESLFGE